LYEMIPEFIYLILWGYTKARFSLQKERLDFKWTLHTWSQKKINSIDEGGKKK
jgi:hypothetical protein